MPERCDFCLEVDIFTPLVKWNGNDVCQDCYDKAEELKAENDRALDNQPIYRVRGL